MKLLTSLGICAGVEPAVDCDTAADGLTGSCREREREQRQYYMYSGNELKKKSHS